jgi:4-carboxymuconolactone decarboxylase
MTKTNDALYETGLKIRRDVLGAQWVDPQLEKAKSDPFTAAIQDMVTEYCWGYGWGQGCLDRKTRSMLNLAILTALGKMTELKAHVRGALHNGCTEEEIKDVLVHATIYCGIPAGVDAFRHAKEALDATKAPKK